MHPCHMAKQFNFFCWLSHEKTKGKAKNKSILRKIFLPTEQMKFCYPVLKKAIWLLPIFYVVRWVQVLFTRPQAIGQLKKMNDVHESDLAYMKEIRSGLDINHL